MSATQNHDRTFADVAAQFAVWRAQEGDVPPAERTLARITGLGFLYHDEIITATGYHAQCQDALRKFGARCYRQGCAASARARLETEERAADLTAIAIMYRCDRIGAADLYHQARAIVRRCCGEDAGEEAA